MQTSKIQFHTPSVKQPDVEPSTCIEAEPYALRVLDDSMEPEFRKGCIIVIDPTGHAREGSYVLAREAAPGNDDRAETDGYLFRQLQGNKESGWYLQALNPAYPGGQTELAAIAGVIVQRAGVRRRYHKHYD